jgi:carbon storage regulator
MLVLSRKAGEKVRIGRDITVTVLGAQGNRVRIGIDAPAQLAVLREELCHPLAEPLVSKEWKRQESDYAAANA